MSDRLKAEGINDVMESIKMKIWVPAALIVLITMTIALAASGLNPVRRAPEALAPPEEFIAHLDQRIPALMKLYRIPGASIALVKEGETIWSGSYGYADAETGRVLTTDTPMRVQSISKPVTAWGVMRLAEQGIIELDAPVKQYLKHWNFPSTEISAEQVTVRQLLCHTAGLPLGDVFTIYSPGEAMPSLEEKLTEEALLIRKPGTSFFYSNIGYNLLELLIEEVTGRDFAEYMEEEILVPLGMNASAFVWSEGLDPAVPTGYDLSGRPVPVYVYPEKGSGGLFSTAEDVAAFTIAAMPGFSHGKQVLGADSIGAMHTPVSEKIGVYGLVFDAYGLGHYIEGLSNGENAVSHGGQGTGIMTHFHAVPQTGDAIVILTNSQRSWPFISCLLNDWGRWNGFSSVGMGKIIWGEYALWGVVGLLWSAALLQGLRTATGIMKGRRRGSLLLKRLGFLGLAQVSSAAAIIGTLVWCLCQKYLFLTSVFPRASLGLGISAFVLAVILLLSVCSPVWGTTGTAEFAYKKHPRS